MNNKKEEYVRPPEAAYVGLINGKISTDFCISLKEVCRQLSVSWISATRGKRLWYVKDEPQYFIKEIIEKPLVRISGRGKKRNQ